MRYRIETVTEPRQYWNKDDSWRHEKELATLYTAEQREGDPGLPDKGCWVLLSDPQPDADDVVFEKMWAVRGFPVEEELKTLCRLWFGRGIMQGVKWSQSAAVRSLSDATEKAGRL